MSDIPRARTLIETVLKEHELDLLAERRLRLALKLMFRVKYVRRAPAKRRPINKHLRGRIKHLVYNTDKTMHEIANEVGLRSGGRVSEVMHGKR